MTLIKWSRPTLMGNRNEVYSWPYSIPYSIFDEFMHTGNGGSAAFVPAVNISEKDDKYAIEVSAAGFKKEDFKVEADNGMLHISAEHKEENKEEGKNFTRREFRSGSFSRKFTLPENVNIELINARYENGILNIDIPKKPVESKNSVKEVKIS